MINLVRNSVSSLMLLRDFLKEEQGIISLYKDAKANFTIIIVSMALMKTGCRMRGLPMKA